MISSIKIRSKQTQMLWTREVFWKRKSIYNRMVVASVGKDLVKVYGLYVFSVSGAFSSSWLLCILLAFPPIRQVSSYLAQERAVSPNKEFRKENKIYQSNASQPMRETSSDLLINIAAKVVTPGDPYQILVGFFRVSEGPSTPLSFSLTRGSLLGKFDAV